MHSNRQAVATASGIHTNVVEACTARGCASGVTCVLLLLFQTAHKSQHTPAQVQAEQSTVIVHAAMTVHAAFFCTISTNLAAGGMTAVLHNELPYLSMSRLSGGAFVPCSLPCNCTTRSRPISAAATAQHRNFCSLWQLALQHHACQYITKTFYRPAIVQYCVQSCRME